MANLVEYYNKFNEDKRLLSRHGQVEFNTTIHYVHECLREFNNPKILDVGAGTGRYCLYLAKEGFDVTAVEFVNYNLGILRKNAKAQELIVNSYQGDARKLKRFGDNEFDVTLLFGPMYHLHAKEDKIKALEEAKRVTKDNGIILVAYVMADYAVIKHGFMENNIKESLRNNKLTSDYKITSDEEELYEYSRLEEIDELNVDLGFERIKIISPDGPADYIRHILNAMDDESFELFKDYQLKNAERSDLIGAGSHTVDILRNHK